jgi:hypothetical protein
MAFSSTTHETTTRTYNNKLYTGDTFSSHCRWRAVTRLVIVMRCKHASTQLTATAAGQRQVAMKERSRRYHE